MAPRPLLISNTDSDEIFPLGGVMEIFNRTRRLYRKLGVEANIGIHIAEGPHKDTQPLNAGAFNWLNRFLKGGDRMDLIDEPASRRHELRELKVFGTIPADEKVTTVDEFFVPAFSPPPLPVSAADWPGQRNAWMKALREEVFGAWPGEAKPGVTMQPAQVKNGLRLTRVDVTTQHPFILPLWILLRDDLKPEQVQGLTLEVLDEAAWEKFHHGRLAFPPVPKMARTIPWPFCGNGPPGLIPPMSWHFSALVEWGRPAWLRCPKSSRRICCVGSCC